MKYVNIIYDDIVDDVDIIAIPDELYQNIELLAKEFLVWLKEVVPENAEIYWVTIDEKKYLNVETEGFVKWINDYYCKKDCKAYIIEQHVNQCLQFKSIEF